MENQKAISNEAQRAMGAAVNAAVDAAIHVTAAAGNDNDSARNMSPASTEKPIKSRCINSR